MVAAFSGGSWRLSANPCSCCRFLTNVCRNFRVFRHRTQIFFSRVWSERSLKPAFLSRGRAAGSPGLHKNVFAGQEPKERKIDEDSENYPVEAESDREGSYAERPREAGPARRGMGAVREQRTVQR